MSMICGRVESLKKENTSYFKYHTLFGTKNIGFIMNSKTKRLFRLNLDANNKFFFDYSQIVHSSTYTLAAIWPWSK